MTFAGTSVDSTKNSVFSDFSASHYIFSLKTPQLIHLTHRRTLCKTIITHPGICRAPVKLKWNTFGPWRICFFFLFLSDIHREPEPRHPGAEVHGSPPHPLCQDLPGESHHRGRGPATGAAGLRTGRLVSALEANTLDWCLSLSLISQHKGFSWYLTSHKE